MHEPLTKGDLKLALENFELGLTIRLCCMIAAGIVAFMVMQCLC
jgi:hypothetical protein